VRTCAEATISLYIRAVLALVSSTLRDTSFKYTTWYSLNNSNRSPLIRSPLDTIDAIEIPAQRVALAGDEPTTSSQDDRRRTPVIEDQREAEKEERARRVRRRRDML
jgi:hypothetical protein